MQIRKPEQPQPDQQPVDIHDTHEAVAIFEDAASLQAAVDAVLGADFDHADLTLLAGQHAVELKLGHVYAKTPVDDPSEVRSSYVPAESVGNAKGGLIGGLVYVGAMVAGGAIFASGGTLGVALAAAAAAGGAGGVVGSILAKWLGDKYARDLQDQIDAGGLVLWVRAKDPEHARRAQALLARHSPHDVQVHKIEAS